MSSRSDFGTWRLTGAARAETTARAVAAATIAPAGAREDVGVGAESGFAEIVVRVGVRVELD